MAYRMRCAKVVLGLICLVRILSPTPLFAELVDRVVAVVNDDIITFSDLNKQGAPLFKKITQEAPPEKVEAALIQARQEMLSNLIDRLIVEQRAAKLGIEVKKSEVDAALERLLAKNHLSMEKFRHELALTGASEGEYRTSIKDQILQSKLVNYEIRSKVVITEEKMKEYYEKNYTEKMKDSAYHILQMGFSWSQKGQHDKENARKRAQEARRLVLAGQDFRKLARKRSDLPSAVDGGDIGVFSKGELSSYMKKSILALQPGEVSSIVETPVGYQFFKLLSNKGDVRAQRPYESVREEIRDILYQQTMDAQYQNWVKELRDEAYIKKLL